VKIGHGRRARFLRYAATSAAATLASAATFAVAYRLLHAGAQVASVTAFGAGALINFTGNRFWTWAHTRTRELSAGARRHRQGLGRDAILYAVLAVATALAATGVTTLADRYTGHLSVADNLRVVLVEAAYFATYAAMFLVKFVLLDRVLFGARPVGPRREVHSTTRA
jgi:putative flippase GtrA